MQEQAAALAEVVSIFKLEQQAAQVKRPAVVQQAPQRKALATTAGEEWEAF
jgi:hypothetical protein